MKIDELETGDIILFSGNYFLSYIVEYFTKSIYSHVGVVLKNPNLGDAKLIKVEILFIITVLFFIWKIFNPESCYVYSLSNPNIII